jgi:hypothetical protein
MYKQIWGKNAEEVIYGSGGNEDQEREDENRLMNLDTVLAEVI